MSAQRPSRAFVRKAHRAFGRMTELQRELFLALRFEEGMTFAKLAERHGITEADVEQELTQAFILFSRSIREPEPWWRRLWPW